MSTYLHPDIDQLRSALVAEGFKETPQMHDDFTLVYSRHGDLIVVDLPESEVYEHVEVHFHLATTLHVGMLQALGFPL